MERDVHNLSSLMFHFVFVFVLNNSYFFSSQIPAKKQQLNTHFWGSHFGCLLIVPEFNFCKFSLLPLALHQVTLQYLLLC